MAQTLLMLSPASGFRIRRTNDGVDDAGFVYKFKVVPRPITWDQRPNLWVFWQHMGLEIRHSGAVDLLVTPIVDSVELTAQSFPLTAPAPASEQRVTLEAPHTIAQPGFAAWGKKITFKIETNTLATVFDIDGMFVDGAPQPNHREQ